jgi:hypothetical protein
MNKKIIKRHLIIMAEFSYCWAFQNDIYDDGTNFCCATGMGGDYENEIDNGEKTATISPVLARAFDKWSMYYDNNYDHSGNGRVEDKTAWDAFDKVGMRLTELLKKQIGHLYDEIYYQAVYRWSS